MEPVIHDLNIIKPAPEYIRLAGRLIDVSGIPSGVALQVIEDYDALQGDLTNPDLVKRANAGDPSANLRYLNDSIDICIKIVRRPFSIRGFKAWWNARGLTRRWLIRHTDIVQLRAFIETTVGVLFSSLGGNTDEGSKKNEDDQSDAR